MKLNIHNRYGIIPNKLLNDSNISFKAKWLFWYLQSKPDDWDFSADRIKNDTKENRNAILSWLKELEENWYLKRLKYKNEKWQWEWQYILYDNPKIIYNSSMDKPETENPTMENPSNNKERNTNKEIQINNNIYNISFENFWKKYPINIWSKKKSKIIYEKYCKQWKEEEINKWLDKYLEWYSKMEQIEKTKKNWFVPNHPHATTWLNQERWNDNYTISEAKQIEHKTENTWFKIKWFDPVKALKKINEKNGLLL